MKKLATVFTAIVMLLATSAFASDGDNVTARVKAAFQTDFSSASQVSWKKTSDFYFASFVLNDIKVDAAYNEDGQLVGTSRQIEIAQVPLNVSLQLARVYEGYQIAGPVFELNYEGETSYYLTAANDNKIVQLKCNSGGEITEQSKIKK